MLCIVFIWLYSTNGFSISSAIFAGFTVTTNTDRQTTLCAASVAIGRIAGRPALVSADGRLVFEWELKWQSKCETVKREEQVDEFTMTRHRSEHQRCAIVRVSHLQTRSTSSRNYQLHCTHRTCIHSPQQPLHSTISTITSNFTTIIFKKLGVRKNDTLILQHYCRQQNTVQPYSDTATANCLHEPSYFCVI